MRNKGSLVNIEFKARCNDLDSIRKVLEDLGARFVGIDHQTDTYFNVPIGRLKLREGNIENALIFYDRPNSSAPKQSDVKLYRAQDTPDLKNVLIAALGVDVVVSKAREIYFVRNVKIHLDNVEQLGTFLEIEAIAIDETTSVDFLSRQCQSFMSGLRIQPDDLIPESYSDLLRGLSAPVS